MPGAGPTVCSHSWAALLAASVSGNCMLPLESGSETSMPLSRMHLAILSRYSSPLVAEAEAAESAFEP